jgi:hypothetical protein
VNRLNVALLSCSLTLFLALPGCVEKEGPLSQAEKAQAKAIVLAKAPTPQHPLDVQFENKVVLLGYDLSAPALTVGKTLTVTWYWHVKAALGEGWKLFTHLADGKSQNRLNLDSMRALRRLHPEETWRAGQYLRDVQEITLPADWSEDKAQFFLGFWNGPHRLHVTKGPHDSENRAKALELSVVGKKNALELPRVIARRLTAPLVLDGKLDEPDWAAAQTTAAFVQTMTGAEGSLPARVRVAYDAEHLYLGYYVGDDFLKSTFTARDDHLWEQDTVEVMIDPDGDGRNYFEIQVAPTGQVFDTRYESRRRPQPFGDLAWSSETKAKVGVDGSVNDDQADKGYVVEMAVPWTAFVAGTTQAAPPGPGTTWRMNFFVLDAREKGQQAAGWSPPMVGDFHTLERFGRVVFPQ